MYVEGNMVRWLVLLIIIIILVEDMSWKLIQIRSMEFLKPVWTCFSEEKSPELILLLFIRGLRDAKEQHNSVFYISGRADLRKT